MWVISIECGTYTYDQQQKTLFLEGQHKWKFLDHQKVYYTWTKIMKRQTRRLNLIWTSMFQKKKYNKNCSKKNFLTKQSLFTSPQTSQSQGVSPLYKYPLQFEISGEIWVGME